MERLSVSLSDESLQLITNFQSQFQISKADVIRKALRSLMILEKMKKKATLDDIKAYLEYLSGMGHLIIDIAHWKAIFCEIGEGSDQFWKEVYAIGIAHGKEFDDKGLTSPKDILEYIEKKNWYKLNVDSEKRFTLILTVSVSSTFVKTFFEGLFSRKSDQIEITEEFKKIRIRLH
jgi:hypothetical protein